MPKDQAEWLAGTLRQHNDVVDTKRIRRGLIVVERKSRPDAVIGIVTGPKITAEDIGGLLAEKPAPQFIMSVPNNSVWTSAAISAVKDENIAFGKMYDVYRGLRENDDLAEYVSPEIYYVERLLRQHRNVARFSRITDRSYEVERQSGGTAVIALSQDYEMTADAVRTTFDHYAPFDALLKTTPYGGISSQGRQAATELGIEILNSERLYEYLSA